MTFHPVPATGSPATFLAPGEAVLERRWQRNQVRILMPGGPKLYMRLQPSGFKSRLGTDEAKELAVSAGLEPMRRSAGALGYSTERNAYGAVVFHCTSELECLCLTQLHYNYELWGIDAYHLGAGRQATEPRPRIPILAVEEVFTYTLENFLSVAGRLDLEPPLRLECGLSDVEGYGVAVDSGAVEQQHLVWETTVGGHDREPGACLRPFFEFLQRQGARRV